MEKAEKTSRQLLFIHRQTFIDEQPEESEKISDEEAAWRAEKVVKDQEAQEQLKDQYYMGRYKLYS